MDEGITILSKKTQRYHEGEYEYRDVGGLEGSEERKEEPSLSLDRSQGDERFRPRVNPRRRVEKDEKDPTTRPKV